MQTNSWIRTGLYLTILVLSTACTISEVQTPGAAKESAKENGIQEKNTQEVGEPKAELPSKEEFRQVLSTYQHKRPVHWGEDVPGVKHQLATEEKVVALTFDACGGSAGSGIDEELIRYLKQEKIPATLFINGRWIDAHPNRFRELAADPLFEIANHGTHHRPLSVNGRSVYGIRGTTDLEEALNEILENERKIVSLTGKRSKFFRSGTAYYDDVAVEAAGKLGVQAVNYDILGDAGGTYNRHQVKQALLQSRPGSIALLHMNRPGNGTAEGVQDAIPLLREQGYRFVTLGEYPLE